MFFSKKAKTKELDHWYHFVENFQLSSLEFYSSIEKELQVRKIPALEISRVEWKEGGLLSANREYLRLTREKWVFDICAAPFGTGYFFSYRFAEIPVKINPLALLLTIWLFPSFVFSLLACFIWFFGWISGSFLFGVLLVFGLWFMRNTVTMGFHNLDSKIMRIPVLGGFYDRFIRKETYYREDTRLMYMATIPVVVKKLVEQVTGANGIKLPDKMIGKPLLEQLAP